MNEEDVKKLINDEIAKIVAFPYKKIGDNPTDAYQLTPKQYVDSTLGVQISSVYSAIPKVNASLIAYSTYSISGVWVKPSIASANSVVYVQLWGAGGGGGPAQASNGGGGGGGGYQDIWYRIADLPSSVAATVGEGGLSSSVGGITTWNSIMTAWAGGFGAGIGTANGAGGGGAGLNENGAPGSGQTGGDGGRPGAGSPGVDGFSGAGGGTNPGPVSGNRGYTGGGGGGGGGGPTAGGNSTYASPGGGGGNNAGSGGLGGISYYSGAVGGNGGGGNTAGQTGGYPGGGGGGAASTHSSSVRSGGQGGPGRINVFTFL